MVKLNPDFEGNQRVYYVCRTVHVTLKKSDIISPCTVLNPLTEELISPTEILGSDGQGRSWGGGASDTAAPGSRVEGAVK